MILDETTYREIYANLNRYSDINRMWMKNRKFSKEFYLVVYTQKTIREVTTKFQRIKSRSKELIHKWNRGNSLLEISREINFSPVMTAFLIITGQEYGRKSFRKMINDPRSIKDTRLSKELIEVREEDQVYSPEGNQVQRKRGILGEEKLKVWLDEHNIEYKREEELRERGGKTPDFLLERPIFFRGEEINWIESKASMGDLKEVKKNLKKQLSSYDELFGPGMVIYWFGIIDDLPVKQGIVIETEEVLDDHWDLN
ncbi:MAG: C15orf41 family protein [Candidatus Thermoplasmatota archaeon]|nr:C15orf41 family protein [Candidatus Thermoplasmatota archaeon]